MTVRLWRVIWFTRYSTLVVGNGVLCIPVRVQSSLSVSTATSLPLFVTAARLRESGRRVIATSKQPGRVARLLDMVSTTIAKRHEYGVAHVDVYSGPGFLYAEAVCAVLRLLRKPYVLTLHGGNLPEFSRRWPGRVRAAARP